MVKSFFKALLVIFFVGGGINHFLKPDFYLNMMPDYLPAHTFLVGLSGVTEIVAGVMLVIPRVSRWGAWFIVAHLMVFFTVHIDMIVHAEDKFSEIPVPALWFRVVMQFVFIAWALWFTGKPNKPQALPEMSSSN